MEISNTGRCTVALWARRLVYKYIPVGKQGSILVAPWVQVKPIGFKQDQNFACHTFFRLVDVDSQTYKPVEMRVMT